MAIPNFQELMRPVLECAADGEVRIGDVVERIAEKLDLSPEEKEKMLPSGRQATFSNRVHWARSYLKQAGLVRPTKRAHFVITERGKAALEQTNTKIDRAYLEQFDEYQEFRARTKSTSGTNDEPHDFEAGETPDEALRKAHKKIHASLAADILDRVREASPAFFENLIVDLLLAMGYGGTSEDAGRALGKSGDDGVDGVIDQDPLGVDQIYVQAKRYAQGNTIGAGAIRDFFGALNLQKAQKGIFFTSSSFSPSAVKTARDLGTRIVLIDSDQLARLMIQYNVGCRDEDVLRIKKVDEDYFE